MRAGILSPCLIPGDAVSNDALGMYESLKKKGIDAYLFADHSRIPKIKVFPTRFAHLFLRNENDVFIYHHATHSLPAFKHLRHLGCRRVVKYHNITPPEFYNDYPAIKEACSKGIEQNKEMVEIPGVEFWVASQFNGQELQNLKAVPYSVLYPYSQVGQFANVNPCPDTFRKFHDHKFNIALIGRVVPNKNIEAGLQIFSEYRKKYHADARLIIVGNCDLTAYVNSLKALSKKLKIQDGVAFPGKISQSQLKAIYMASDLLMIPSKHEGYCVPLVEAMAVGVPVIANRSTALPFTGGDAIAYFDAANTQDAAAKVNQITSDAAYRNALIQAGKERYCREFTNEAIEDRFLNLFFKSA